jgi:hypothetical protein
VSGRYVDMDGGDLGVPAVGALTDWEGIHRAIAWFKKNYPVYTVEITRNGPTVDQIEAMLPSHLRLYSSPSQCGCGRRDKVFNLFGATGGVAWRRAVYVVPA